MVGNLNGPTNLCFIVELFLLLFIAPLERLSPSEVDECPWQSCSNYMSNQINLSNLNDGVWKKITFVYTAEVFVDGCAQF